MLLPIFSSYFFDFIMLMAEQEPWTQEKVVALWNTPPSGCWAPLKASHCCNSEPVPNVPVADTVLPSAQSGMFCQSHCFSNSYPGQTCQVNHLAQITASGWDKCTLLAASMCASFHAETALPSTTAFMVIPHFSFDIPYRHRWQIKACRSTQTERKYSLKHALLDTWTFWN